MILPIDEKWRLKSDAYCWHVQQHMGVRVDKDTGAVTERWDSKRYYQSLAKAVHGLAELELMAGDTRTLAEALDAVRDVSERLSRALAPHIEILGD